MKKNPIKKNKKKKSLFGKFKYLFLGILFLGLLFSMIHYRQAIRYYLTSKFSKNKPVDKVAQARIYQILDKYSDKVAGIDVSQFQGKIDWEDVKMIEEKFPIKYVFIRATAGDNKVDSRYKENWKKAKKYGFLRGAYHYYRPNENSVIQAKLFIKTVSLQKGDFPPVLDIEKMPKEQSIDSLKVGLKRWLKLVDEHYKIKPIIYTSERYYEDFLKDDFNEYTFWVANYNFFAEDLKDDWLFWQFSEKGRIKGIDERVDINIYNGTPKMLEYLTISN